MGVTMQEREYLEVLIQSLRKKLVLLNKISVLNQEQRELLADANLDPDTFEVNVRDKEELVQQIVALDEGFDEVYAHLKDLLERDHRMYTDQIEQMKGLIRQIMAKDASVRAEERRNFELARQKFESIKKQVREVKASQKMVNSYYQNMMKQSRMTPQFMDNKK